MKKDYLGLLSNQRTVDVMNAIETIRDTERRDICRIRDLMYEIHGEDLEHQRIYVENTIPQLEDILVRDYDLRSGQVLLQEDQKLQKLLDVDGLTPENAKLFRDRDRRDILSYLGEKGEIERRELVEQFAEEQRRYEIKLTHHYLPQFKDQGVIEETGDILSYQGGEELLDTLEQVEKIYQSLTDK